MTPSGEDRRSELWALYAASFTSDGVPMYDAMLRLRTTARAWGTFLDMVPRAGRGTAADYGAGPGVVTRVLARNNPDARVIGVEREDGFIERARRELSNLPNVELRKGDLGDSLPLGDGEVDLVGTHNFVFPYLTAPEQAIFVRELARVHAPGSVVLGSTMLSPFTFRDVVLSNLGAELADVRALAIGLRELVPKIASQLDKQMHAGWMCSPTLEELRALHLDSGFASFEVLAPIMPLKHVIRLWKRGTHAAVIFRAVRGRG